MDLSQFWNYVSDLSNRDPDAVTQGFLALILAVFVVSVLSLEIPLIVRQLQLRSMRRSLKGASTIVELPETGRAQLESRLQRSGWAKAIWSPFLLAWKELYDPDLKRAAQPTDFLEFCTPHRVIPGIANRRLASAIPGILVALGILGTFLGLTLGLPEQTGEGAADATAINRLIGGLRTAFTTSLVGISASLVFLTLDRFTSQTLERSVRRLGDVVSSFFPSISLQMVQRREARERTESTGQLKTLATDIAVALENSMGAVMRDAVGEAMQKEVAPVLGALQDSVSRLGDVVSGDMAEALRSFSDQINENVSTAFQKSFADLTKNLEQVVQTQDGMRDLLGTLAARAREQAQIQERLTDRVIAAADALGGLIDSLASIATQLQAASDSVNTATNELLQASEKATVSQQAIAEAHEGLAARVSEDLERLQEARSSILEGWKAVAADARDSIAIVEGAVQQLGSAVGDNLLKALGSFDEKLAEVTTRFSGTLHEVRETIHELPELLVKMTQSAEEMGSTTKSLRVDVQELVQGLQSSVGDSTQRAKEAAERLSQVTERAGEVASDFTQLLERYTRAAADAGVTEGVDPGEVVDVLRELQQMLGDLSTSASAIEHRLEEHVDRGVEKLVSRLNILNDLRADIKGVGEQAEDLAKRASSAESGGGLRRIFGRR